MASPFQNPNQRQGGNIFGNIFGGPNQTQATPLGGGPASFGGKINPFPGVTPFGGSSADASRDLVRTVFPFLTQAAPQAVGTGLGTLQGVLDAQGQTDPALLNRQLADISSTTQGQQTALQGQLARLGIQNSGVGQALGAAIGQGGAETRAQTIAQETALAEERKRSDLINLLLPLLIQPAQQSSANLFGLAGTPNQPSDFEAFLGGVSSALPSIPGLG
jgi:hypothetical protein